jgi:NAD(P)H-dependent FMN reductase
MKNTLAFAGSNSKNSINHQLITYAAGLSEDIDVLDLREYASIPMYRFDDEQTQGIPPQIQELYTILKSYKNIILASPEHNGLPPAFLKNILDWLSRTEGEKFFQGKKIVLLSTSPGGYGGANNLINLKKIIPYWGADVVATFSLPKFYDNIVDGQFVFKNKAEEQQLLAALQKLEFSPSEL